MNLSLTEILNVLAFLLTIIIVLYGLSRGFNIAELILNVMYFSVILITLFLNFIDNIIK